MIEGAPATADATAIPEASAVAGATAKATAIPESSAPTEMQNYPASDSDPLGASDVVLLC